MKNRAKLIFCAALVASMHAGETIEMEEMVVSDVVERLQNAGALKDALIKTETLGTDHFNRRQALNIAEAIDRTPGVSSSTGCSMCAMRRIRINGLRGEHTTVLVDGIPLHSTVSSYYGMDAQGTAGVSSIEIARGSGTALAAPEAIGGTINIVTKKATENSLFVDIAAGDNDYRNMQIEGTAVSDDGRGRLTVAGQHSNKGQWDEDDNGVNEAPEITNYGLMLKGSYDITKNTNIDLRFNTLRSEIFGGPMVGRRKAWALNTEGADPTDVEFVGGDVNNRFLSEPMSTLEYIQTTREEGAGRLTHDMGGGRSIAITGAGARQIQNSMYEGGDYMGRNRTIYGDFKYTTPLGSGSHLLTAGFDVKHEILRSESVEFYEVLGMDSDNFDFLSTALFVQNTWTASDRLELSGALRLDRISVDWEAGKDVEVEEIIVAPRVFARYEHTPGLVSRLSLGTGYRAPLTFFESEHGILDEGFDIEISELEKSFNTTYALSYDTPFFTSTLSAAFTKLDNMAYIEDEDVDRPTLMNADESFSLFAVDAVVGYQINPVIFAGVGFEYFHYEDEYKELLPVAAIEKAARVLLDFDWRNLTISTETNIIGSRDLEDYGYDGRYNVKSSDGELSSPKKLDAPTYATFDAQFSYKLGANYTIYGGAKNLFNYTQAGEGHSPLFWDDEGSYDVGHIWGPLTGRQLYVGIRAAF